MFVYQNGKLYAQHGDKLVGVDVTPTSILAIKGTETKLDNNGYELLTHDDVMRKFAIIEGKEYKFPVEKEVKPQKEVKKDGQTSNAKSTTRKSPRK